MKETAISGIIRRFDDLGRIVVPREIRRLLQLREGDAMEISVAENSIHLNKWYGSSAWMWSLAGCESMGSLGMVATLEARTCSVSHMAQASRKLLQKAARHGPHTASRKRSGWYFDPDSPLPLLEDGSHPVDTLWPIGTKGQPMGAVVLPHYRTVTGTERACARLIADILTETIIQEEKDI